MIIPARTHIAIQNIGSRETERSAGEGILPPHLIDVLDAASELTSDQRARSQPFSQTHTHVSGSWNPDHGSNRGDST